MGEAPRWWRPGLLSLFLVAALARVAFSVAVAPDLPTPGDAVTYRTMAASLRAGDGLQLEAPGTTELARTAEHPPLFPVVLAALDLGGAGSRTAQRVALSLVAAAGAVVVALLGRRLGGHGVGLVAGGIAALHPIWVQPAGMVMSESVQLVLVPLVLLAALRARARPSLTRLAVVGLLIGLAALNRPEALGLLVAVGVPVVVLADGPTRGRLLGGAAMVGMVALLVVPWVARNHHHLGGVAMTTNTGKTVLGSSCDATFAGPRLGGFDYDCQIGAAAHLVEIGPPAGAPAWDGRSFDDALGASGWDYVRDHADELPKVVAARVLRMWGLAFSEDQLRFDVGEGRSPGLQRVGQWVHLTLLVLAVLGAVLGLRSDRRRDVVVLLGPVVLATATTLVIYGGMRMRTGAEPTMAVLAAVALVHGRRWGSRPTPEAQG